MIPITVYIRVFHVFHWLAKKKEKKITKKACTRKHIHESITHGLFSRVSEKNRSGSAVFMDIMISLL